MSKLLFANIIFLFLIIVFIYLLAKFVRPRLRRVYRWKTNLLLAGAYLALLVVFIPLALFVEQGEFFQSRNDQAQGLFTEAPANWSEDGRRYHIFEDEPLERQAGLVENSRQTYAAATPRLKIKTSGSGGHGRIFLERKKNADGIIEVSTYAASHYVRTDSSAPQSFDFTKLVAPPQITWEEGLLKIEDPVKQRFGLKVYGDSFPVRQFKGEKQGYYGGGAAMVFGEKGVVVRIPADMEVVDGDSGEFTWMSNQR